MNVIFFEDHSADNLLPFTYSRPTAEIRVGIMTIKEKWQKLLPEASFSYFTKDHLKKVFSLNIEDDNILINGSVCPFPEHEKEITHLERSRQLVHGDKVIALRLRREELEEVIRISGKKDYCDIFTKTGLYKIFSDYKPICIERPWHIFALNGEALLLDFKILTKGRKSAEISSTNRIAGSENIFLEEGAKVEFSIINAQSGPVYIAKDAEIMEGCMVRGPLALCEGAALKMGTKIYGPTTIGPHSKVGGEVNNSVILGFSNKGHDGFLGNSVIGEWCNLGADTNNSNLKNNYAEVKVYGITQKEYLSTGLQFCGLFMGDHSKSGINTMFNTGTVVGFSSNIFGSDFPPKYIPSFSWGGAEGASEFSLDKAIEVAERMYERRGRILLPEEKEMFRHLFEMTAPHRKIGS
jgi:UDP-N-acetylglucosamine diphosphorylase/glucosamine-1-phosphate N-acetyltransferase